MIGFIVPVPGDDAGSTALLNTLISLTMQAGDFYEIVVVSEHPLTPVLNHPLVKDNVVHVLYDPADAEDRKAELAAQHIVGLQTLGTSVDYSMVVPVGTYVNEQVSRNIPSNSGEAGWYIETGILLTHNGFRYHSEFYQTNVTGYILNTALLQKGLQGTIANSTAHDLQFDLTEFIFRGVYGLGEAVKAYFAEVHKPLTPWPDSVTVASPENGQKNKGQLSLKFRAPVGLLERVVYEMNLPLIDHWNRRIAICVDDENCVKAFENSGTNVQVPMTAREIHAVWGDEIWSLYKKTAYVRNPWDLMLNKYKQSPLSKTISLADFIRKSNVTRQVTQISVPGQDGPQEVIASEGVSDIKHYEGHYRDHYDDESKQLVQDGFWEDIENFDYGF